MQPEGLQEIEKVMRKKAVVSHSGGMDSSICLALAIRDFGKENVLSLSFDYGQRHNPEIYQAAKICKEWGVDHSVVPLQFLQQITSNALLDHSIPIKEDSTAPQPNTFVVGRNGLMARLAAIHTHQLGARSLYLGIIEVEGSNSGYPDCTRKYFDLKQEILRIDLCDPNFEICTPLVYMTKKETLELAYSLEILEFLLKETITCYEGIKGYGCRHCPACKLRNEGLSQFLAEHPQFSPDNNFHHRGTETQRIAKL